MTSKIPLSERVPENISAFVLIIFLGFFTSCVTQRRVEYLQDRNNNIKSFKEAELPDYKLKPDDELYIQITSLDEAAANVFSNSGQGVYMGSLTPYGASLISYSVDKEGYLVLPVIGKILVKDKTLQEVSLLLKDSLNHILNQPIVSVKLVNRYVSVLGEVKSPGHFPYSQEKITIYDALGLAGDITDYGNRNEVILIRNVDGQINRINVNLNSAQILSSEYFNLRPNDIIYVKPLKNKFWGMREFPFSILFSSLTTGLLIYQIFK
jgi:polysaccharide biosynthesis/export protein